MKYKYLATYNNRTMTKHRKVIEASSLQEAGERAKRALADVELQVGEELYLYDVGMA